MAYLVPTCYDSSSIRKYVISSMISLDKSAGVWNAYIRTGGGRAGKICAPLRKRVWASKESVKLSNYIPTSSATLDTILGHRYPSIVVKRTSEFALLSQSSHQSPTSSSLTRNGHPKHSSLTI